jgi:hypothetical protein
VVALIEHLQKEGVTRATARRATKDAKRPSRGRPRHYVFRYQPKEKGFALALQFKKAQVPREEIVRALQAIIEDLMREDE